MKVFISQPMIDKTDKEILDERNRAIEIIKNHFGVNNVEILNSFFEDYPSANMKQKPLFYLGKSIQVLAQADCAYFCKDWDKYRGCTTEHFICKQYGIKTIEE